MQQRLAKSDLIYEIDIREKTPAAIKRSVNKKISKSYIKRLIKSVIEEVYRVKPEFFAKTASNPSKKKRVNHTQVSKACSISVSVLFTDDKTIHKLNRDYRGKDKATDVLSFAFLDGAKSSSLQKKSQENLHLLILGDLVISIETAKQQAKKYECSFEDEIKRLTIHGMLHLLGYDHEGVERKEARKMRRLERKLMGL